MTTFNSKVCIVGDFAVGKTSTVERFVNNEFSEKYLTTIGVKIDTRQVVLDGKLQLKMIIWDIAGSDRFGAVEMSYMRGASAYLLIADGTRPQTLDTALELKRQIENEYGPLPFILLLNKSDLKSAWEINDERQQSLRESGATVFTSSAKTGENVERALTVLASMIADREAADSDATP